MKSSLFAAAELAGIGAINFAPSLVKHLAQHLLDAAKRHAKALRRKIPRTSHTAALEALAGCAGFGDWHAMHTTLLRIAQAPEDSAVDLGPMAGSLRMLMQIAPDVPPDEGQRQELERFADDLASRLGASVAAVRDALAYAHDAYTWADMVARDITVAGGPLYAVRVWSAAFDTPGEASLVESDACRRLVEAQDAWFLLDEGVFDESTDHRLKQPGDAVREAELRHLLLARPDFLYGYLVLGEVLRGRGAVMEAREVLEEGVVRGMAMLRQHKVQSLPWGSLSNRFFHRLLGSLMVVSEDLDRFADAVALAEWQIILNPNDNQGVRLNYARLRLLAYQHESGDPEVSRLAAQGQWLMGLRARFEMGLLLLADEAPGAQSFGFEHLLMALFQAPQVRDLVMCGSLEDGDSDDAKAPAGPDEDLLEFLETRAAWYSANRPDILAVARRRLSKRDVIQAEARMAELRRSDPTKWVAACEASAGLLALAPSK